MSRPHRYNEDRTQKGCSTCKAMQPVAAFQATWSRNRLGEKVPYLRAECRACNTKRGREWRQANRDRRKPNDIETTRAWRAENLTHYRSYQAEYHRAWAKRNPARIHAYGQRRRRRNRT